MPDITMCPGDGCPRKDTCYRYVATPSPHWQSYSMFLKPDGTCDYYWPTTPKKEEPTDDRA